MGIADELITRGWSPQQTEERSGAVCLLGALGYALDGNSGAWAWLIDDDPELLGRLFPSLTHGDNWGYIADFNDAPGRSFDEVLRVAKEADELLGAA